MVSHSTRRLERLAGASGAAWGFVTVGLSLLVAREIAGGTHTRIALAAVVALPAGALAFLARERMLFPLLAWLVLLGTTRRVLSEFGVEGNPDPLLLIGPASVVAVFASTKKHREVTRSALSKGVLALLVLALLGAANPLQGSMSAGAAGALLVVPPLLCFWIGRRLEREVFLRVLRFVVVLAVPAAAYGLYQTLVGLPSWDRDWLAATAAQYHAINVGGVIRSFGSFSSAAEYGAYCSIAVVVLLGVGGRSRWKAALLVLLVAAVAYEATRTFLVGLVAATALMFAAHRGTSGRKAIAVVVVLVAAASLLAAAVSPLLPTQGAGALVRHQMEGLAHPLDQKKSTLRTHIGLVREGIQTAFTKPLGSGSGAASLAGAKFGSGTFVTEADPSNAAVAWGIPGLLAYLVVAAAGLRTAYRQARLRRGGLELAVLGLLIVSFLQWLNGGYYAVSLLPWLALGWLDRDSEALT